MKMNRHQEFEDLETRQSKKWEWVQFKRELRHSDWIPTRETHHNVTNWGYGHRIEFQPTLTTPFLIFGQNNLYLHKNIVFPIFISLSDKTDDVDLRLCCWSKSTEEQDNLFQELAKNSSRGATYSSYENFCKLYVWKFDICLVKLVFTDKADKTRAITKRFHLEFKGGNCDCKRSDHLGMGPSGDEFAHFQKSGFLSKSELKNSIFYEMEWGKREFVPLEFQFRARLQLRPVDINARISPIIKVNSSLIRTDDPLDTNVCLPVKEDFPLMHALSSIREGKLNFFEMDSDVLTFQADTKIMQAHSWIFAAESSVFSKTLSTGMIEQKTQSIKLKNDISEDSLKIFLTHLYQSKGYCSNKDQANNIIPYPDFNSVDDWTVEISLKTLQLANDSQVLQPPDLIDFCVENIISRPDSEFTLNLAVQIFKGGMLYGIADLKCRSAEWIMRQTNYVKRELKELLIEESTAVLCEFLSYLA